MILFDVAFAASFLSRQVVLLSHLVNPLSQQPVDLHTLHDLTLQVAAAVRLKMRTSCNSREAADPVSIPLAFVLVILCCPASAPTAPPRLPINPESSCNSKLLSPLPLHTQPPPRRTLENSTFSLIFYQYLPPHAVLLLPLPPSLPLPPLLIPSILLFFPCQLLQKKEVTP